MRETTERKVRKGKAMAVETTTTITCDGCGASRSHVHGKSTSDEKPWYRIQIEMDLGRTIGQSMNHFPVGPRLDACTRACAAKALAKVPIPSMDAIWPPEATAGS